MNLKLSKIIKWKCKGEHQMTKKIVVLILAVIVILIVVIIFMYLYKPYKTKAFSRDVLMPSSSEDVPNPIVTDSLIKSSSLVDVTHFHSGNLKVSLSNPMNLKHQACEGMKDEEMTLPIFFYLLKHEKYGYFLIDSGCDLSYEKDPYGSVKGLLVSSVMPEIELESSLAIENQLSQEELQKINAVFLTHLHFDHTAGLPALTGDIPYIAGKGERSYFMKGILESNHFNGNDTIYTIDFDADYVQDFPIGKAVDLFGDNTVWAISTPGHSEGHISYLVNSKEGPILIAGDACILNQSIELGVGSGTCAMDVDLAQKTLDKIMLFLEQNTDVTVWCGHDFPK
jgi:glyoxylase-like metal-dependent hydrolase (beta-lactamase superfamily II)